MRLRGDYGASLRWLQWTGNSLLVEWTSPRNCNLIEDLVVGIPRDFGEKWGGATLAFT